MLLLKDIKGQKTALRYLENSREKNRVASSYLFSGPIGVGRSLTAKAFIASLVCSRASGSACGVCSTCKRIDSLEHPDITWVKPEKNKKIRIEEIRKIKDVLSLKPFESAVNVGVIEDAHMMTTEASNAILKVLEEPPGAALLILITDKKELLLPTVISRCAEVRFTCLPISFTKDIVMEESGLSKEEAFFVSYFAQGSPGGALQLIEEGVLERKDAILRLASEIAKEDRASCMNWDEASKDVLIDDIELLIMLFRDITLIRNGITDMVLDKDLIGTEAAGVFEEYSEEKILELVDNLISLKRALTGNVNAKLVSQVLPGMIK